jgi:AcrR family transcriptional regulator
MLDIAADLMSQQGYAGTSVAEIVGSAGVGPPTLYWHFKSKRGILAAVMQRGAKQWITSLPHADDLTGSTGRERFVVAMRAANAALRNDSQFLRLLIMLSLELAAGDDVVRDLVREIRRDARAWIVAVLQRCWPALPMHDANRLAAFQMALADGWLIQREIEHSDDFLASEFSLTMIADKAEELSLARRLRRSHGTRRRTLLQ